MQEFKITALQIQDLKLLKKMQVEFTKNISDFLPYIKYNFQKFLFKNHFFPIFLFKKDKKTIKYKINYYTFCSFLNNGRMDFKNTHTYGNYRKKDYKQAIFQFLRKIYKKNFKKNYWICLDSNVLGINIYKSLKAEYFKEQRNYCLSSENLKTL